MKVLVVEDDPQVITAISLLFQIRWPEAQLISTQLGEIGIELVKSEAPDVVILDLGLPDIDGFEVLERVRCFSTVPTVILSARAGQVHIAKALTLGANDYIVKPFKPSDLLSRIKSQTIRCTLDMPYLP